MSRPMRCAGRSSRGCSRASPTTSRCATRACRTASPWDGPIEAARRDGVPDALPTAADFDTRARDLQARYEEAWLACRIIAERLGEQGLVAVYDAAARGGRSSDALRTARAADGRLTSRLADRLELSRAGWIGRCAEGDR